MEEKNLNYKRNLHKSAPKDSFSKARNLRKDGTESESKLWFFLKNKKLDGYKFRRQHPLGLFIVDFYCHQLGLIIEVDGPYHNNEDQKIKDANRTKWLESNNMKLLRFTNNEIRIGIKKVLVT